MRSEWVFGIFLPQIQFSLYFLPRKQFLNICDYACHYDITEPSYTDNVGALFDISILIFVRVHVIMMSQKPNTGDVGTVNSHDFGQLFNISVLSLQRISR